MNSASNLIFCLLYILSSTISIVLANFPSSVDILFGNDHVNFSTDGSQVDLTLDKTTGSGFQSKNSFIYGKFDIQMKLVPGNSAGTVATFYLNSTGTVVHNELDFEFLGDLTSQSYTLQTNIFVQGVGLREQRFCLWFDPSMDYHNYTIIWNSLGIIFYADNKPIRYFPIENQDLAQQMILYATLWDGSDWATGGGTIKIDWSQAPFVASYRNYNVDACVYSANGNETNTGSSCDSNSSSWMHQKLTTRELKELALVRKYNMVYDYCHDSKNANSQSKECLTSPFYVELST